MLANIQSLTSITKLCSKKNKEIVINTDANMAKVGEWNMGPTLRSGNNENLIEGTLKRKGFNNLLAAERTYNHQHFPCCDPDEIWKSADLHILWSFGRYGYEEHGC